MISGSKVTVLVLILRGEIYTDLPEHLRNLQITGTILLRYLQTAAQRKTVFSSTAWNSP